MIKDVWKQANKSVFSAFTFGLHLTWFIYAYKIYQEDGYSTGFLACLFVPFYYCMYLSYVASSEDLFKAMKEIIELQHEAMKNIHNGIVSTCERLEKNEAPK